MTTWSMGHLVVWWLKQVHYTSYNSHLTADILAWPVSSTDFAEHVQLAEEWIRSPQPLTLPSAAFTRSGVNGIWRMRAPVASNIALPMAAAVTVTAVSPAPAA